VAAGDLVSSTVRVRAVELVGGELLMALAAGATGAVMGEAWLRVTRLNGALIAYVRTVEELAPWCDLAELRPE
jgi:hypothetical protein